MDLDLATARTYLGRLAESGWLAKRSRVSISLLQALRALRSTESTKQDATDVTLATGLQRWVAKSAASHCIPLSPPKGTPCIPPATVLCDRRRSRGLRHRRQHEGGSRSSAAGKRNGGVRDVGLGRRPHRHSAVPSFAAKADVGFRAGDLAQHSLPPHV
jgi:hypothetical protein